MLAYLWFVGTFLASPVNTHNLKRTDAFVISPAQEMPAAHTRSLDKIAEIRQKAGKANGTSVLIDCNVKLDPRDRITKRLIFEGPSASGITFDGNGATIDGGPGSVNYQKDMIEVKSEVRGEGEDREWRRPENITITNCLIVGSVRIWGMARNGEGKGSEEETKIRRFDPTVNMLRNVVINRYRESSMKNGHIQRARDRAPRNIVLNRVTIRGVGRVPLYFSPGVTNSQLLNSTMKGRSDAPAVYLDAESSNNTIKDNKFTTTTGEHWAKTDDPLIAIDGSSHNKIIGNEFRSLRNGGVYIYRNCGLGGVVRHASPSNNSIIGNTFYYKNYKGSYYVNGIRYGNPSVWIGSRSEGTMAGFPLFGYCDDDDGFPYGSSKSDLDNATHNVVRSNKIYKLEPKNMFIVSRQDVNTDNVIEPNQKIDRSE